MIVKLELKITKSCKKNQTETELARWLVISFIAHQTTKNSLMLSANKTSLNKMNKNGIFQKVFNSTYLSIFTLVLVKKLILQVSLRVGPSQIKLPLCPIHVVTFTLISNLATDVIQKRIGHALLLSFEYSLSPKLISK